MKMQELRMQADLYHEAAVVEPHRVEHRHDLNRHNRRLARKALRLAVIAAGSGVLTWGATEAIGSGIDQSYKEQQKYGEQAQENQINSAYPRFNTGRDESSNIVKFIRKSNN